MGDGQWHYPLRRYPPAIGAGADGEGKANTTKRDASQLAANVIDKLADGAASADDRASRKSRLLKGPEEFREARVDRPKAKK